MNPFKVGERVIYPNQGLGIIEDIQDQSFEGENFRIYHLRIISNNTLILIPFLNADEIGIRRPINEASVKKIFNLLRNGAVDITTDWKGRYKEHVSLMKSGIIFDLVSVLKSLFYLNLTKPLSFREKKMMEKAKELIVSEISEVSSLSSSEIEQKVLRTLSLCFKNNKPSIDL
jgi:CarD family transcriptional regulator